MNIKNLSPESQHMIELTATYFKEVEGKEISVYESLNYILGELHSFSGFKPIYDLRGKFERSIDHRREILRRLEENKRLEQLREQQEQEAAREREIERVKAKILQDEAVRIVDGYNSRCVED